MKVRLGFGCGLALAAAVGLATTANADFDVNVFTQSGDTYNEDFDFLGYTFGSTVTDGPAGPDGLFVFTFWTEAGTTYDYDFVIDYSSYDIGFFNPGGFAEVNLTNMGGAYGVGTATASYGSVVYDATSIMWTATVDDILANNAMAVISWNQIPAPGALALLGLAGLAGARRRRA